jgi:hypothetical protein
MLMLRTSWCLVPFGAILLAGCGMFQQSDNVVLIREPGQRTYSPPVAVSETAKLYAEYAMLSTNVYSGDAKSLELEKGALAKQIEATQPSEGLSKLKKCLVTPRGELRLEGWTAWDDVPSTGLIQDGKKLGLFVKVFEKRMHRPRLLP